MEQYVPIKNKQTVYSLLLELYSGTFNGVKITASYSTLGMQGGEVPKQKLRPRDWCKLSCPMTPCEELFKM